MDVCQYVCDVMLCYDMPTSLAFPIYIRLVGRPSGLRHYDTHNL
jgi:hypothetical protein